MKIIFLSLFKYGNNNVGIGDKSTCLHFHEDKILWYDTKTVN